jgi:hypothetical protein
VHADPVVPGKSPEVSDEHVEVTAARSKVNEIVAPAVKPTPLAWMVLPTAPLWGKRAKLAVTTKVAFAAFVPSEATRF